MQRSIRRLQVATLASLLGAITDPAWAQTDNETQKLLASDGVDEQHFGISVAMVEDTAIVGTGFVGVRNAV